MFNVVEQNCFAIMQINGEKIWEGLEKLRRGETPERAYQEIWEALKPDINALPVVGFCTPLWCADKTRKMSSEDIEKEIFCLCKKYKVQTIPWPSSKTPYGLSFEAAKKEFFVAKKKTEYLETLEEGQEIPVRHSSGRVVANHSEGKGQLKC